MVFILLPPLPTNAKIRGGNYKFIDKIPAGKEPDIFALGHYHQALYALHRDIHGFMPGSFLKENMLSKRFQLGNTVGGWIVEIEKDEKGRSKINMEYLKF